MVYTSLNDAKAEVKRLRALCERLAEALAEIAERDKPCGCEDHTSETCCACLGFFCPFCITSAALAAWREEKGR